MDTELLKGTLSLLVLAMLAEKPMYGYELASTVRDRTLGTFTFKEGSLYPCLHKLQMEGLLKGQWEEGPSEDGPGRKRRYYHITDAGRAALEEKLRSWEELCGAVNRVLEESHGQSGKVPGRSLPGDRGGRSAAAPPRGTARTHSGRRG
ncbi:MAG TPA: PadR family transcriptional regulator [Phycisphaerae bacterium]|nr:PadR family transcriptional regulator [Phycisphaerae bacterium]